MRSIKVKKGKKVTAKTWQARCNQPNEEKKRKQTGNMDTSKAKRKKRGGGERERERERETGRETGRQMPLRRHVPMRGQQ